MRLFQRESDGRLMRFARRFDFRRLHKEEGGNVIVLYIAAALLLVGMLWAIIGTGARVVQKETLQSAADAAAFSAAVIKAKGMNIIAFCNLLMALLLAIIIILRLIKYALLAAAGIAFATIVGAGIGAELMTIYGEYSNVETQIENGITKAMEGIGKFERGVKTAIPLLAETESVLVSQNEAYTKGNFGSGRPITVTLPLADELPTKDGTWDELCTQAELMIDRILDSVVAKVVGPQFASWLTKGLGIVLHPFESLVCGGGSTSVQINQPPNTNCTDCAGGSPTASQWNAVKGGVTTLLVTDGFPGDCGGGGFTYNGVTYDSASFQSCTMQAALPMTGGSFNKNVKPLDISADWKQRTQVRAFTVLAGTNMDQRRQSVGVAKKGGAGEAPTLDGILTMAQAEFLSWNKHNDLWHMDWRARLVPFTVGGDTSGTNITSQISSFMNSSDMQGLTSQFLVH